MNHKSCLPNTKAARRLLRAQPREGAALLVAIFVIAASSLLVVRMLDNQTSQIAAIRNTADYERALYLAGAAAHHAVANLEADPTWRGTVVDGAFPANDTYSATATDGANPSEILITATGVAGQATRRLQVTVRLGS